MFDRNAFEIERVHLVEQINSNQDLQLLGNTFVNVSNKFKYAYLWNWFGLPIIQMPEDIVKVQELIYENKPDLIIETGVAWGGSLLLYASVLKAIGKGKVIGIDLRLPEVNRKAIESSPFSDIISLVEGSSTDIATLNKIKGDLGPTVKLMLILDSHHTHQHVLDELNLWSPFITKDQIILVCDTIVEFIDAPQDRIREWRQGNNPMTAVREFLAVNDRFSEVGEYNKKQLASFHPMGVLKANY